MPRITPNLESARNQASVETLNELTQALGAMGVLPHYRPSRDSAGLPTDLITAPDASDLGTSQTLARALAIALTAHGADVEAHSVADAIPIAAWASSPAVPANLAEVQAVLNEVKADFNTHIANATPHRGVGGQARLTPAQVATANASDQGTSNTLANALKAAINAHARAGAQTIQVVAS